MIFTGKTWVFHFGALFWNTEAEATSGRARRTSSFLNVSNSNWLHCVHNEKANNIDPGVCYRQHSKRRERHRKKTNRNRTETETEPKQAAETSWRCATCGPSTRTTFSTPWWSTRSSSSTGRRATWRRRRRRRRRWRRLGRRSPTSSPVSPTSSTRRRWSSSGPTSEPCRPSSDSQTISARNSLTNVFTLIQNGGVAQTAAEKKSRFLKEVGGFNLNRFYFLLFILYLHL